MDNPVNNPAETKHDPVQDSGAAPKTFVNSLITDDRWFYDPILVAIMFSVLLTCSITCYEVFHLAKEFDAEKFGNGVAFILGAGGVGYGAKRFGEKHRRDGDE